MFSIKTLTFSTDYGCQIILRNGFPNERSHSGVWRSLLPHTLFLPMKRSSWFSWIYISSLLKTLRMFLHFYWPFSLSLGKCLFISFVRTSIWKFFGKFYIFQVSILFWFREFQVFPLVGHSSQPASTRAHMKATSWSSGNSQRAEVEGQRGANGS